MDAGDILRQIQARTAVAGLNIQLLKSGTNVYPGPKVPTANWSTVSTPQGPRNDDANALFDVSTCTWDLSGTQYSPFGNFNTAQPTFLSYQERTLVQQGLMVNGSIPIRVLSMQTPIIGRDSSGNPVLDTEVCPAVQLTVPLNNQNPNYMIPPC
jgi:hypothetical protein